MAWVTAWHGFDSWPQNFHMPWVQTKKKKINNFANFSLSLSFFFFLPHQGDREAPRQGSNRSHSCNLCCSCINIRSLTHCTTARTLNLSNLSQALRAHNMLPAYFGFELLVLEEKKNYCEERHKVPFIQHEKSQ